MDKLVTEEQLAEALGLTLEKVRDLRRREGWPHVRFGRLEIRFTADQVTAIIDAHTVEAPVPTPSGSGLPDRSAAHLQRQGPSTLS